jgi:hypothetical protein
MAANVPVLKLAPERFIEDASHVFALCRAAFLRRHCPDNSGQFARIQPLYVTFVISDAIYRGCGFPDFLSDSLPGTCPEGQAQHG